MILSLWLISGIVDQQRNAVRLPKQVEAVIVERSATRLGMQTLLDALSRLVRPNTAKRQTCGHLLQRDTASRGRGL
jgi:hypothetical protein